MWHQDVFLSGLTQAYPDFLPDFGAFQVDGFDGSTSIGPSERLGKRLVEVINEGSQSLLKIVYAREVTPPQHSPCYDPKNDFDLVQPRSVLWQVNEMDAMAGVRQKLSA